MASGYAQSMLRWDTIGLIHFHVSFAPAPPAPAPSPLWRFPRAALAAVTQTVRGDVTHLLLSIISRGQALRAVELSGELGWFYGQRGHPHINPYLVPYHWLPLTVTVNSQSLKWFITTTTMSYNEPEFPQLPPAPPSHVVGQGYSSHHPVPTTQEYQQRKKEYDVQASEFEKQKDAVAARKAKESEDVTKVEKGVNGDEEVVNGDEENKSSVGYGGQSLPKADSHTSPTQSSPSHPTTSQTAPDSQPSGAGIPKSSGQREKEEMMDRMNANQEKPTDRLKKGPKGERRVRDPVTGKDVIIKDADPKGEEKKTVRILHPTSYTHPQYSHDRIRHVNTFNQRFQYPPSSIPTTCITHPHILGKQTYHPRLRMWWWTLPSLGIHRLGTWMVEIHKEFGGLYGCWNGVVRFSQFDK